MDKMLALIRVEQSGFTLVFRGGERNFVAAGDAEKWKAVRRTLADQCDAILQVPEWATLRVALPGVPRHRWAMRAMLKRAAPVLPDELARTKPRPTEGGGAETSLVRLAWLNPLLAEVERELGLTVRVIVEPSGDYLVDQRTRPEWSQSAVAALAATMLVAAAVFGFHQWERVPDVAPSAPAELGSASPPAPEAEYATALAGLPLATSVPAPTFAAVNAGPPELIGIAGRLPDDAEVLVKNRDGQTLALRIGEEALGWRLISIAADRAVFEGFGLREVLTIPAP